MLWFIPAKMPISINSPVSLNGFRPNAVAKSRTMTGGLKWMILMSPDAITVTEGVEVGTGTGGAAIGRETGGGAERRGAGGGSGGVDTGAADTGMVTGTA